MNINILLDKLPQYTSEGLKIRTNFKESIKFELLMQDNKISEVDKLAIALNLYYYEVPKNIEKAVEDLLWFYRCGKEIKTSQNKEKNKQKQIYSYEFDAEYIYSSFMEQYKIDLNTSHMHWWKFKALFEGLNENTQIVKIMGYRAIDLGKIKDKEEKAYGVPYATNASGVIYNVDKFEEYGIQLPKTWDEFIAVIEKL